MEYSLLGRTGVRVSKVALGTYPFGVAPLAKDVDALVGHALDIGINVIDTSNSYGNQARFDRVGAPSAAERESAEELVGKAIKSRRDEVVLCTKVQEWMYDGPNGGGPNGGGLTRYHIMQQVEQTLRRMQTDHIDIYHMHHPDPTTPLDWTLRAMDDLVRQGKVRYIAVSNFPAWQMVEAQLTAEKMGTETPVVNQVNYNLINRAPERELVPAALRFGISITCYSPLAGGLLTGAEIAERPARYNRPGVEPSTQRRRYDEGQLATAEKMDTLGAEWGMPPARIALAWLLSRPAVAVVVTGPETIEELDASAAAADTHLDEEQLKMLAEVGVGVRAGM